MDISLINQCISSLILDSNKLVIPGLGALLRKHLPNGKEKITFSTLLRYNDGILQKEIEKARDLTEQESALVMKLFVNHVRKAVESKEGFVIPQVGILRIDELKDIVLMDENVQPEKMVRIARRVADIDIAEDTEIAEPVRSEQEMQLAKAKAKRLDDLQARLLKLNSAKETSIQHLREVPQTEQQMSIPTSRTQKTEGVEVILEEKKIRKDKIEVVLHTSVKESDAVKKNTVPAVEIPAKESIVIIEEVASSGEGDPSGEIKLATDDMLLGIVADEKKKSSKSFWIWLIIALMASGLCIVGFVKSDQVEKLWKGTVLDRWFWNLVEPMSAKMEKVVVMKSEPATVAVKKAPTPVVTAPVDPNADLIFEEGKFYVIAGSYSTREAAQKGIVVLKTDQQLKVMPFERGRVKFVLVAGRYDKEEDARIHLKDWEGSWILCKPLKK